MSPRRYNQSLQDILDSISHIEDFVSEMEFDDFAADRKTVDAVIRNIEIIGEATKNIPIDIQEKYPDIPWSEMAKMRDKVIHGYFDIAYSIVWETIMNDLEPLKQRIQEIIDDSKE